MSGNTTETQCEDCSLSSEDKVQYVVDENRATNGFSFVLVCEIMTKSVSDENDLLDRLQDDFDSQPEFHCHLFGLGGRGRSLSTNFSPREPAFPRRNDYR